MATFKGWGWPFAAPLSRLLRFTKKLTGKRKNICLRLSSNYIWHVNSRERSQSRKFTAGDDRTEDQEWHWMSLNFSPHPLVLTALLTTSSCPISHFGSPPPLTGFSFAGSCCVVLSFFLSALLSLLQTPVFEYFFRLHLHTIGCSLCPGRTNMSQCCFFAPKWDIVYTSNCHVKLCMYASSCKANKGVLFLHSWWLWQRPQ